MPQLFTYTSPAAPIAADSTVEIEFTPRGNVDVVITNTGVSVKTTAGVFAGSLPAQSFFNGNFVEGTPRGNNDSSDTRIVCRSGDVYKVRWTGGTPGTLAQLALRGVQYAAGSAPWE